MLKKIIYLSPVYSPKIYVGHITTESIFHECYMEKWICIYSYSMINSVQSALDTYWNKHPFCGRNLHCHMFVFQQSLLLVLYKLIRIMYTQHHVTLHSKDSD